MAMWAQLQRDVAAQRYGQYSSAAAGGGSNVVFLADGWSWQCAVKATRINSFSGAHRSFSV